MFDEENVKRKIFSKLAISFTPCWFCYKDKTQLDLESRFQNLVHFSSLPSHGISACWIPLIQPATPAIKDAKLESQKKGVSKCHKNRNGNQKGFKITNLFFRPSNGENSAPGLEHNLLDSGTWISSRRSSDWQQVAISSSAPAPWAALEVRGKKKEFQVRPRGSQSRLLVFKSDGNLAKSTRGW